MIIRQFRILIVIVVLCSISACSTYPSKFKCGDAKGLGCTMLHEINTQIDNGQIEQIYKKQRCDRGIRGKGNCHSLPYQDRLMTHKKAKAKLYKEVLEESDASDEYLEDNNNLYF